MQFSKEKTSFLNDSSTVDGLLCLILGDYRSKFGPAKDNTKFIANADYLNYKYHFISLRLDGHMLLVNLHGPRYACVENYSIDLTNPDVSVAQAHFKHKIDLWPQRKMLND